VLLMVRVIVVRTISSQHSFHVQQIDRSSLIPSSSRFLQALKQSWSPPKWNRLCRKPWRYS